MSKIIRKLSEEFKAQTTTLETPVDIKISMAGKGVCIVDETDGKTYRITTQNGVLVTTEVV